MTRPFPADRVRIPETLPSVPQEIPRPTPLREEAGIKTMAHRVTQKPPWIRTRLTAGGRAPDVMDTVESLGLHTVCREAHCPNQHACFSRGTATFILLGPSCTRNCTFCAVKKAPPSVPDPLEPERVAEAVVRLGLSFCVLTMVTRDDLPDGGADHVARTIEAVRRRSPRAGIEVLVSDLKGRADSLKRVLEAGPQVLNHNLETVRRLYPEVRPQARYERSLELLARAASGTRAPVTKSGLMLGLGEEESEVIETLSDLRKAGCDLLTLGQYLSPSEAHHPVVRYVPPEEFETYERRALGLGFRGAACGPLVRSSYRAGELYRQALGSVGGKVE